MQNNYTYYDSNQPFDRTLNTINDISYINEKKPLFRLKNNMNSNDYNPNNSFGDKENYNPNIVKLPPLNHGNKYNNYNKNDN